MLAADEALDGAYLEIERLLALGEPIDALGLAERTGAPVESVRDLVAALSGFAKAFDDPDLLPPGDRLDFAPGQKVGKYVLGEELGRGGMGVVYQAQDALLDRTVAIKFAAPARCTLDQRLLERFTREAQSLAQLRHPGIVAIVDRGDCEGVPFFVMDFVDGESLRSRLEREGTLPPKLAAALCRDLAKALALAHGEGLLHRDVKPANVMIDSNGAPVLMDFGLVRLLEQGDNSLTQEGSVVGTVTYMAPEQARGAAEIDARADVYALGAVLYRALVGSAPFEADLSSTGAILAAKQTQKPTPIRELAPEVSPALAAICLRCLEPKPADRYATAAELEADLERILAGKRPRALAKGTAKKATNQPRRASPKRQPAVAALVVGAVAALVGIGLLDSDAPPPDSGEVRVADEGLPPLPSGDPDGVASTESKSAAEAEPTEDAEPPPPDADPEEPPAIEWTPVPKPPPTPPAPPADVTPPTLSLVDWQDDRVVRQPTLRVRGQLKDAGSGPFTSLQSLTLVVAGSTTGLMGGDFEAEVTLTEGSNTIPIEAKDAAGNTVSRELRVTLDSKPPALVVSELPEAVYKGARRVRVEWTSDDPDSTTTASLNGKPLKVTQKGGAYRAKARLKEGENTVSVSATDLAGNVSTFSHVMSYQKGKGPPKGTWWKPTKAQLAFAARKKQRLWFKNRLGMRFALIPPGRFLMGGPAGTSWKNDNGAPHTVTLTAPFYLCATEVSNAQLRTLSPKHDSGTAHGLSLNDPDQPAAGLTWVEAQVFCTKLSQSDPNWSYRLPTEAEWEYASRAGSKTLYPWGDDPAQAAARCNYRDAKSEADLGWERYAQGDGDDGFRVSAPVGGRYPANPFGLFDMSGNVGEWVQDRYTKVLRGDAKDPTGPGEGDRRVRRGGSWNNDVAYCRSGFRKGYAPGDTDSNRGFRLVAVRK